jgi:hypothetical protein
MGLFSYLLFAALALVGTGISLQRVAGVRVDTALVLPLGTAATAALYWASLATGVSWVFPTGILVLWVFLAIRRPRGSAPGPALAGAIPPFLVLVALLAATQYPWNRRASDGDFLLDPLVTSDTAFHVGLTRELDLGYPPQLPGVAGFPIGYHLGTDLGRAAALRWAGVDPYDSISRFDVTLFGLALVLVLRTLVDRLFASAAAVALVPWTLFLTDFSFLFGANPQAHWWTDLLRGNLLLSLVAANPIIPALAMALGALVALERHRAGEGGGWLFLSAALALAVPFFKVFLGAHLLLGLGVAGLLAGRHRLRSVLVVATPCAAATLALVLGQGGETVRTTLAPLDLVTLTRESLGLAPLTGIRLAAWGFLWIVASLGLRVLGLGEAVKSLRSASVSAAALAGMALAAWPLGLLFRVSAPEVLPGQKFVNDAAYLVEQGGPLLWIFTVLFLATFARTPARRIVSAVGVVVLALPTTIQFVVKKSQEPPDRLPAATVRAMDALAAASRPGDVVMQRPGGRYPPAPVVLLGRRVPYERFTPYLTQFASRDDLEKRHEEVFRFFRTTDVDEAMAIARKLDARFLCLYGGDRVRFQGGDRLVPLHEEAGARLYRLADPGTSSASAADR